MSNDFKDVFSEFVLTSPLWISSASAWWEWSTIPDDLFWFIESSLEFPRVFAVKAVAHSGVMEQLWYQDNWVALAQLAYFFISLDISFQDPGQLQKVRSLPYSKCKVLRDGNQHILWEVFHTETKETWFRDMAEFILGPPQPTALFWTSIFEHVAPLECWYHMATQ